jgi:hypothetical protein
MKKGMVVILGLWVTLVPYSLALGADIRSLSRDEATRILQAKGYTHIVIGAIVEGTTLSGTGGPNTAMVFAIAKQRGSSVNLQPELLLYDRDIGWCDLDIDWNHQTKEYAIFLYTTKGTLKLTHEKPEGIPVSSF